MIYSREFLLEICQLKYKKIKIKFDKSHSKHLPNHSIGQFFQLSSAFMNKFLHQEDKLRLLTTPFGTHSLFALPCDIYEPEKGPLSTDLLGRNSNKN